MALGDVLKQRFADGCKPRSPTCPGWLRGRGSVYPLCGLKWALILLNDFLPERFSTDAMGNGGAHSSPKAQSLVGHVERNYPTTRT